MRTLSQILKFHNIYRIMLTPYLFQYGLSLSGQLPLANVLLILIKFKNNKISFARLMKNIKKNIVISLTNMMLIVQKLYQTSLKKIKLLKKSLNEKLLNELKLNLLKIPQNMWNSYNIKWNSYIRYLAKPIKRFMIKLIATFLLHQSCLNGIIIP